ncbi:hypothetical protein [Caldanaerobius polysaccharolyticus]|uniref:hypothetical protein n=1 Tax=Caldanaerobius polysaccharolyticus TaxID=44256 RepID=UPI0004788C42|nr:hypothetical protein [Caldanaerobius polysaccharolyticus]
MRIVVKNGDEVINEIDANEFIIGYSTDKGIGVSAHGDTKILESICFTVMVSLIEDMIMNVRRNN